MATEINELQQAKTAVYDYCRNMLGDVMVDVELAPIHYETALDRALGKYRRGDSSVEESYMFLTTVEDQNTYTLPKEVIEVRQIFRRSIGSSTGSSSGGSLGRYQETVPDTANGYNVSFYVIFD
jgi:hypothetical protein